MYMETKFVKPSLYPVTVVKRTNKLVVGVFDGVRRFDNGSTALLKNGVVSVYSSVFQKRFDGLEDVFVAPNGYTLLKRKGADVWQLVRLYEEVIAEGEQVNVFQKGNFCLVFLKQRGKAEWLFYNVGEHSFLPSARTVVADTISVHLNDFQLVFILKLGGKTIIQKINTLYLKPEMQIDDAPFYVFLPDGSVAVSAQSLSCPETLSDICQVMPAEGEKMTVYSADFKKKLQADGLMICPSGAFFAKFGESWTFFVHWTQVKGEIYHLTLRSFVSSIGTDIQGKTADGKDVYVDFCSPNKIFLDYAGERFFIFDERIIINANDVNDVFLV